MPSPFLGMDPFLEHYMWSDIHASLAPFLKIQINTKLTPELIARVEVNTYTEDVMLRAKSSGKRDASILDLNLALASVYDTSRYGTSIDYSQPLKGSALSEKDQTFLTV